MRYFITPNYCVPLNAKCGSSSLCRRIIATYYPDVEQRLQTAHYPPGFSADKIQPHRFVPDTSRPDRPVAMLVREPLDRFLSGVAYLNINLEAAIDSLVNGSTTQASRGNRQRNVRVSRNVHFAPQAEMPYGETHLFRFPDHLQDFASLLGIGPVPQLNVTPRPKPTVTAAQTAVILGHYAADVALYASITQPGVVIHADTEEMPDDGEDE
jgi:hypothetical protein